MLYLHLCLVLALTPFDSTFMVQSDHALPVELTVSGEAEWTHWSQCAVSPQGDIVAIIDPERCEVRTLQLQRDNVQLVAAHTDVASQVGFLSTEELEAFDAEKHFDTVARQGIHPDQVNLPIAVAWDDHNILYVSDNNNRRVSVFNAQGVFRYSFLLPEAIDAPWNIQRYAGDTLLLSSLKIEKARGINAGYHCNLVTPEGKLVRSFAYTPASAFSQNLWTGLNGHCAVDANGATYVAFSNEPVISVYSRAGELVKTFGEQPPWWVSPPIMPEPGLWSTDPELRARCTWTRVVKLVLFDGDKLLRVAETNGLVPNCTSRFLLDVYSTDGCLLSGNIASDYWPVGVTGDGSVFFLSVAGDQLLKVRYHSGD